MASLLLPLRKAVLSGASLQPPLPASPLPRSARGHVSVLGHDICTHTCQCETKEREREKNETHTNVYNKYQAVFGAQILNSVVPDDCIRTELGSEVELGVLSKDEVRTEEALLSMVALLNNVVSSLHWNC